MFPPDDAAPSPVMDVPRVREGMAEHNAGSVRAAICAYAWDCATAIRVFTCESGLESTYNPSGSYGIAQIQWSWHRDKLMSVAGSDDPNLLFDPAINLAVAWMIYSDQGWGPWTCA
jgi:hypothetical protein